MSLCCSKSARERDVFAQLTSCCIRDEADASKTGKKWAARQQQEVEERNRQRAAEREAEIAAAKLNYADQAAHAVALAKTNEQREFEMKERYVGSMRQCFVCARARLPRDGTGQ